MLSCWECKTENSLAIPQKVNIRLYNPAIPFLGIVPATPKFESRDSNKYVYTYVHNTQRIEAAQMSITRWMDKPKTVSPSTINIIHP